MLVIQDALETIMSERTCLVIYHRLYQLQYEREEPLLAPHEHATKILG